MTHYEDGTIVMDTDYAPVNASEPLKSAEGPTKFVVVQVGGQMEDHMGMILEDTTELRNALEQNPEIKILASGTCEVSLSEFMYAVQSPTRQIYRALMSDLTELVKNRFTGDDQVMREMCNNI